jgi:argonaute-like protein implicated in RNA metabolism and viral defense
LRDSDAGFFVRDPLQRQYLILPQSVQDSFGPRFLADLKGAVNELFPQEHAYDPIVATYNDRVQRTFVEQGNAILQAAAQQCTKAGFAVVMIHETEDRKVRQHDQLAAMVIRKLRDLDICAAVIHSTTGRECYQLITNRDDVRRYVCRDDRRGKLSGYIRNVALNKVLLTNERWPFVLATPLSADLTVGIDVKLHTAGFTVVNRNGNYIRTIVRDSNQKEQLLTQQVRKLLTEVVTKEARTNAYQLPLSSLVIHRDGILWPTEKAGILKAIEDLQHEGIVATHAKYAMLEIPKNSAANLRMYEVENDGTRNWVQNPQIGTYLILDAGNAYLCATGRAFPRHGTVQPVHVKHVGGTLPIEASLQDLYFLTALAWTRPDDCARDPITIKLTDRRLGEDAEVFDLDALEYHTAGHDGDAI